LLELHLPSPALLVTLDDVFDVLLHEELEGRRGAVPDERFSPRLLFSLRQVPPLGLRAEVKFIKRFSSSSSPTVRGN
jgi:hypothetical protein